MTVPAGNSANTARGQWTPGDNTGQPTAQVAGKVAAVQFYQGGGHPHAPGYTATCEACRLEAPGIMLALYDRQARFLGFASPRGWVAPVLPETLEDHAGRRFGLYFVTPTTAIYSEMPAEGRA